VIGGLMAFKTTQIWQRTGDPSIANDGLSYLSLNIGCTAPRSLAQGPYGLYFTSSGGPYFIDQLGAVRSVTHSFNDQQPDIQVPMQNAVTPTRWAGAYCNTVYRVCGPTVINNAASTNDYWFDEHRRRWTGPHTFVYDCATSVGQLFVLSSVNNPGILIVSSSDPNQGFPVTDLGTVQNFNLQSATFPKTNDMFVKQVAESQIELAAINGTVTYTIIGQNEAGNGIGQCAIVAGSNIPRWDDPGINWDDANLFWTDALQILRPKTYPVPWTAPLVFEKMQLSITGTASNPVGIGTFYARYQQTGYMTTGLE
jgi:hypothetical protein